MAQITSSTTNSLVVGLNSLNTKPSLQQVGRAPPKTLDTETETELLSGLGVAQKLLFSEKNSQQLAIANANKGLSFVQTADSALDQSVVAITQLRALAVRAASEDLSEDEREELQEKADALIEKVNEVAESTSFDGKTLFNGSLDTIGFELGGDGKAMTLVALKADAAGLGLQPGKLQTVSDRAQLNANEQGTQGIQEGDASVGDISDLKIKLDSAELSERINIADVIYGGALDSIRDTDELTDPLADNYGAGIAKSAAERINEIRKSGQVEFKNVFADATTTFTGSDLQSEDFSGSVDQSKATTVKQGTLERGDLVINGVKIDATAFLDSDSSGNLTKAINAQSRKTGIEATVDDNGELSLAAADGRDIVLSTGSADVTNQLFGGGKNRFSAKFSDLRITGRVNLYSNAELTFIGSGVNNLGLNDFSAAGSKQNKTVDNNIATVDLSSSGNATQAIESVDSALGQIRNFKVALQDTARQFEASLNSVDLDFGSRNISGVIANLSQGVLKGQPSKAVAAQANVDATTTLFFLRS